MSVTSDDTPKKSKAKKVDRNDPARFMDPGLSYRGKLIGVEDVQEPRGDKMCLVAMAKLKAAVKTIGDHKQKIVINVSLDGIKIIDEKTESLIYFHPVHRISFISRDANDSRAFGYVFGAGGGSHQFYGIKTEKVAEGIVLCLRDLFQVVFEMKKQGNELSKRSIEVDDRVSDPHSFSSPKPVALSRGAWRKSDHHSQSLNLPASSSSPSSHPSAVSCHSSATPVIVKKGVVTVSNVCQSPVLLSYPPNPPKEGASHLPHQSPTATPAEPIYQNASVLSGHFHCQMQPAVTSSTPPACSTGAAARFFTPEKSETPASAKGWVSFDFDAGEISSESVSEMKPIVRKRDPFANDPFFSKTPGSEESGGEVVVWSQAETHAKATSADASSGVRVEPIYGFFVEPGEFADFSGFKGESVASDAAWIPVQGGVEENGAIGGSVSCERALDAVGLFAVGGPEHSSDRESSSDAVSFPSPDAPPPPLPQNTPALLDYRAPVPPPRPGSSCSKSDPSSTQEHSIDLWVEGIPPALPLRPSTMDNPLVRASDIPPPPPPRSDLATISPSRGGVNVGGINAEVAPHKRSAPQVDCSTDPFAMVAISKRATKPDSTSGLIPVPSAPKCAPRGLHNFPGPSPIPPRKASLLEDSTSTLCDDADRSFSPSATCHNGAGEFPDPFSALDPFATKDFRTDPFASVSDVLSLGSSSGGGATSDLFGKQFSADSMSLNNQGAATANDSDTFDDVFSSRDESDEKTENSSRSPASAGSNGQHRNDGREREMALPSRDHALGSGFNTSGCNNNASHSIATADVCKDNFPVSGSVEFSAQRAVDSFQSQAKSKFDAQSSFDSVMDDFARRFPSFDDNGSTLAAVGDLALRSTQSPGARPADPVQPLGGATAGKSRLSIPKSSDSSSNSEIAEAFGDDGQFLKQMKS